jgi:plasmid stabilization system protein ParE
MVQKIIWNKTAQRSFDQIITYLQDEFSTSTAEKFFHCVYNRIGQLTVQPLIGRPSKKAKTVRQINIDKHRKMFYRIEGRTLIISGFYDTRQNPDNSRF